MPNSPYSVHPGAGAVGVMMSANRTESCVVPIDDRPLLDRTLDRVNTLHGNISTLSMRLNDVASRLTGGWPDGMSIAKCEADPVGIVAKIDRVLADAADLLRDISSAVDRITGV